MSKPGAVVAEPLDKAGAAVLTERIRDAVNDVWRLLHEAHERRAWEALGYPSFRSYVNAEFDLNKSQAYRLLAKAEVVRALAPPTSARVSPPGDTRPLVSPGGDTQIEDAVAAEIPPSRAPEVRKDLPAARRTASRARGRAEKAGAEPAEAAAVGARAVIAGLPKFQAPQTPGEAEARARRAAEYRQRTGQTATKPAPRPHCPTCTCVPAGV